VEEPSSERAAGDVVANAREKFACPACGADANWNPTKQALVCPFCGVESPFQLPERTAGTVVVEHDLVAALNRLPGEQGWKAEKTSVRCQSCRAVSVFDAGKVGRTCEFCGSAQLLPYEEPEPAFSPESLLPLKVSESNARDLIRRWYGRQWFAPNALGRRALTDTVKAIYLPFWTFDAEAYARWTRIGHLLLHGQRRASADHARGIGEESVGLDVFPRGRSACGSPRGGRSESRGARTTGACACCGLP